MQVSVKNTMVDKTRSSLNWVIGSVEIPASDTRGPSLYYTKLLGGKKQTFLCDIEGKLKLEELLLPLLLFLILWKIEIIIMKL